MANSIQLNKDEIVELINKGLSRPVIAKQLGIGTTTLATFLKKYNLGTKGHLTDFSGRRYGKLTVIEKVGYSHNYKSIYLCKCDCGNMKTTRGNHLRDGSTISCGCDSGIPKYKEAVYNRNLEKIGEKYGRLTIIDIKHIDEKNRYKMVCRCDCGNMSEVSYSTLKRGGIVSCGCYLREISSKIASNRCSSRCPSKRRWYFVKDGERVPCRSSYEVLYANYLMENNIEFEYERKVFRLEEGKRYTPDFYIKDKNLYIEIKGVRYDVYDKSNQQERFNMFKMNHNIDIYHWKDLVSKCNLPYKTYKGFKDNAEKIGTSIEKYLANKMYIKY